VEITFLEADRVKPKNKTVKHFLLLSPKKHLHNIVKKFYLLQTCLLQTNKEHHGLIETTLLAKRILFHMFI